MYNRANRTRGFGMAANQSNRPLSNLIAGGGGVQPLLNSDFSNGDRFMEFQPIRVMIVDDHDMLRAGLAMFLSTCDDLQLVAEASSGEEALALCLEHHPDVVLMDLVMPGQDGVTTTKTLRERCEGVQVIALSSFVNEDLV